MGCFWKLAIIVFGNLPLRDNVESEGAAEAATRAGAQDDHSTAEQLYSPAMLAELLKVSVRVVRRWHRAGLLHPSKTLMQIPHFSYSQIATAKQLASWMRRGVSVQSIQYQVGLIRERLGGDVALESLSIVAQGKRLVLRQGDTVIEATGQLHFGFDAEWDEVSERPATLKFESRKSRGTAAERVDLGMETLDQMVGQALAAEDADDLDAAIDWYRAALAAFGPNPDICFQLAELLYRQGDLPGARERYYMALELDPHLVEAHANLGCVLAECGQIELAIAAFEGTLKQFEDYADVHFHLARTLDDAGHPERAVKHWQRFLDLAPASPWAEEATERLNHSQSQWLDF